MPAETVQHFAIVWVAAASVMAGAWWLQQKSRNAGIVDVAWAAAMAAAALFFGAVAEGNLFNRLLVAMLGGIWGFRLALHLLARVLSEHEDGRYAALREHWGEPAGGKFFLFFQVQALSVVLFALPFYIAASHPGGVVSPWIVLGVLIWALSLAGETIADQQLARFRANPRNRGLTCRSGLWRYSRHPNYFFEWLHWFGYVFLSLGTPHWWLSLSGVVLMGVSLCWVTGIPFAERQALRSRGEDYRRYQQETSVFFPWFPRNPASH